jgi:hypothetical protein
MSPSDPILCPVCRTAIHGASAVCWSCDTPHHPDCWRFGSGCAVFACGQTRARLLAVEDTPGLLQATLVLTGDLPDPPVAATCARPPAGTASQRPGAEAGGETAAPPPRIESRWVLLVSWVYLGASLIVAIPCVGWLIVGLTDGDSQSLARGVGLGAGALILKTLGDMLAVGDPRGRAGHIVLCVALAVAPPAPDGTHAAPLAAAALPVLTRAGRRHFSLA